MEQISRVKIGIIYFLLQVMLQHQEYMVRRWFRDYIHKFCNPLSITAKGNISLLVRNFCADQNHGTKQS
jgi:hypothetical protein